MNKEETERAVKLLEKAIKDDYLSSSEVQEFYEMFKENKVGIFLESGELYYCNKKNAERLIKKLSYIPTERVDKEDEDVISKRTKVLAYISSVLGIPIALLELTSILQGKELSQATIEVANTLLKLIQSLVDLL